MQPDAPMQRLATRMPLAGRAALAQTAADLLTLAAQCAEAPRDQIAMTIAAVAGHLLDLAGRAEP